MATTTAPRLKAAGRARPVRHAAAAIAAVVVGLLLVGGCASQNDAGSSAPAEFPRGGGVAEDFARQESGPDRMPLAQDEPLATREVVTTAYMSIHVDDPRDGAERVVRIVTEVDGRIDERSEHPERGTREASARLTVRVPAAQTQNVLDQLEELGEVDSLSVDATDVTARGVDLDARIRSLQRSVDRLLEIIAETTTAEDLINAEIALADRQAQLESFQSQRALLSEQVALSTITVSLTAAPPDPTPAEGFLGGLERGWNSLIDALKSAIVGAGVVLPWLGFLALLGGALYAVVKAVIRKKSTSPQPEAGQHPPNQGPANQDSGAEESP